MIVAKIRQIVLLKQLMRRWKNLSLLRPSPSPTLRHSSSSKSGFGSGSGRSVRAGCLAVYVGPDRRRFVIPTRFLNLPVLKSLLERTEEEYGFHPPGGLVLLCDPEFFDWVVDALESDEGRFGGLALDAFLALYADVAGQESSSSSSCNKQAVVVAPSLGCGVFHGRIQKARV